MSPLNPLRVPGKASAGAAAPSGEEAGALPGVDDMESLELPESVHPEVRMKKAKKRTSPRRAVVSATFDASVDASVRRRLRGKVALAVVLLVPSPAWILPMKYLAQSRFASGWEIVIRDVARRLDQRSVGEDEAIAKALSEGRSVLGIATQKAMLPSTLLAAADIVLEVQRPDGFALAKAITRVTGRRPSGSEVGELGVGLDLNDLVAAFRPRSTPMQIVERLSKSAPSAAADVSSLPLMETATEYGEARLWAMEMAQDLRDYRAGRIPFSEISRGLVVHGETGTGKTLFAQMAAAHAGLNFIAFSIADLFSGKDGNLDDVIRATNEMFTKMAANAPCLGFLDELDALPDRATLTPRGRDWWLSVCSNFLVKLDGINVREKIIFLGATNYIDRIDAALLRPGRFERAIEIKRPDLQGTINILRHHAPSLSVDDASDVGRLIEGFTGAEIMKVARDARRLARREGRDLLAVDIRRAALPDAEIPPERLRRICLHESAHAVASIATGSGVVRGVYVDQRNTSFGRTMFEEDPGADLPTRASVEASVVVLLAGRAAEQAFLSAASVGSGGGLNSDIATATRMITSLHASVGLGDDLVFTTTMADALDAVRLDPTLAMKVGAHLAQLDLRATALVEQYRTAIGEIAAALAAARYLSGETVRAMLDAAAAASMAKPKNGASK